MLREKEGNLTNTKKVTVYFPTQFSKQIQWLKIIFYHFSRALFKANEFHAQGHLFYDGKHFMQIYSRNKVKLNVILFLPWKLGKI